MGYARLSFGGSPFGVAPFFSGDEMKSRIKVKDLAPQLNVVNLDERPALQPAQRIALTDRELCRQLGIEADLMRALLRSRAMHLVGPSENAILGGLLAEELAALTIAARLIQWQGMPVGPAGHLVSQLSHALLEATNGIRVVAICIEQNKGSQVEVKGGTGDIAIPEDLQRFTTLYDATILVSRIKAAMDDRKLKLPKAKEAIVKK